MFKLSTASVTIVWLCLLSCVVSAPLDLNHPIDPPQSMPALQVSLGGVRIFISNECKINHKLEKIQDAWKEARELGFAMAETHLDYTWYPWVHKMWLGKRWDSEGFLGFFNYAYYIRANFKRTLELYARNNPNEKQPGRHYIYFYCNDKYKKCAKNKLAHLDDQVGLFWSNHNVYFCADFYDKPTLKEQITRYEGIKHEQKIMSNFENSRGFTMFHETMHMKNLVTYPQVDDWAYHTKPTYDLAKNSGTSWAYVNADSYAFDATAIYVHRHYKSSIPPVPWEYLKEWDPEAAKAAKLPRVEDAKTVPSTYEASNHSQPVPLIDHVAFTEMYTDSEFLKS